MISSIDLEKLASWLDLSVSSDHASKVVSGIKLDSRHVVEGDVFIAYRGESLDGYQYIQKAIDNGALAIIAEKPFETSLPLLIVEDARKTAIEIARKIRSLFSGQVFAITGSAGKSSTKTMLTTLLGDKAFCSPASFNNLMGLSRTFYLLDEKVDTLILEMGMNASGEILELCQTFAPQGGLITNIGEAHVGKLGSPRAVYEAKREMFHYLAEHGAELGVALNKSNSLVDKAFQETLNVKPINKTTYSFDSSVESDVQLVGAEVIAKNGYLHTEFKVGDEQFSSELPFFGLHHAENLAAALAAGLLLGRDINELRSRFDKLQPAEHRGQIFLLSDDTVLIDESYNSNPSALESSLSTLVRVRPENRKVIVLADMRELGDFSEVLHRKAGKFLAQQFQEQNYLVIGVGQEVPALEKGIREINKECTVRLVHSVNEAIETVPTLLEPNDVVFVKGSRGGELDRLVKVLRQSEEN